MALMEGINLYSVDYYKKTVFKGSYRGIRFRIGKSERPVGAFLDVDDGGALTGGDEMEECLHVWAWKGPYILEKTDEEVFEADFDFTDEGLNEANEWIESKQKEIIKEVF